MNKKSIDSIIKDFSLEPGPNWDKKQHQPLTIWIPIETKTKYDECQYQSKKRFGKMIKRAVIAIIDEFDDQAS